MPVYKVTAVAADGEMYHEVVEAADRFAVYRDIRTRGDRVLELKEATRGTSFSLDWLTGILSSISLDEKVILTRNLAAMLDAGLTISRALGVMERQSKNRKLKSVLGSMIGEVKGGATFSSALTKFPNIFSSLLISMVKAGEESGKLAESLRVVSEQMQRTSNLTKKIRGALIYPAIVVIAMIGIGILMLIYVVPTLTQTFEEAGADLPATTEGIIAVSNFLVNNTVFALGLFLVFVITLVAAARSTNGQRALSWIFLRIPVIRTIIMETYAARTARTLSSLLSSGVDFIYSLTITREVVGNPFYQKVLSEAEAAVGKGEGISKVLALYPNLYPPMVSEMIAVGEETGRLSDLLRETATFYEESVEQQTKDLSTIVEPVLMVLIGGAVGFFAISMIAPIYSLSNALG
jgi:type IV pilus assembly protein PilC